MSIKMMNLVWENARYKGCELLTLLALADFANDEGISWPSQETLAKKSRQTDRNVRRCIERMEKDGVLVVRHRPNTSDVYRIVPDKLSTPDKLSPDNLVRKCPTNHQEPPQLQKPSPSRKRDEEVDPRHAPIREVIQKLYAFFNEGLVCPWDGKEASAMKRLLVSNPSWSADAISNMVVNRFKSEVNRSERPLIWIKYLPSYAGGPLNEFRKPLKKSVPTGGNVVTGAIEAIKAQRAKIAEA